MPVAARFARSDGVAIGIFQGNGAARLSGTGDGFAVRGDLQIGRGIRRGEIRCRNLTALAGIAGRIGGGGGDLFPVGEWRTEINRKFPVAARLARSDGVAIGIFQGNRAARLSGTGDGFAVR